jgi:hypothetical protein
MAVPQKKKASELEALGATFYENKYTILYRFVKQFICGVESVGSGDVCGCGPSRAEETEDTERRRQKAGPSASQERNPEGA